MKKYNHNKEQGISTVASSSKMNARPKRRHQKANAFTLIEMMIAVIIVGLGITSLMFSMAAGTRVNEYGGELSNAVFLADQIGTIVDQTAFKNLPGLNGQSYSGIDSDRNPIPGMETYNQTIAVQQVSMPNMAVSTSSTPEAYLITVTVVNDGQTLATNQWLKTAP